MKIFEAYDMFSIEHVMHPNDVYFEIGAHRGKFLKASKLFRSGCRYFFYEPGDIRNELESFLKKYRIPGAQVTICSEAIWSSEGEFDYYADVKEGQGNTLVEGVHPKNKKVKAITFERALARYEINRVRFLAINAEQAEYEILKSSAMDRVDFVTCEFHPGKSGISTLDFIREHLPGWETLKFGRAGEAYNQWLGRRR